LNLVAIPVTVAARFFCVVTTLLIAESSRDNGSSFLVTSPVAMLIAESKSSNATFYPLFAKFSLIAFNSSDVGARPLFFSKRCLIASSLGINLLASGVP